jgi:hypothetical protein
MANEAINAVVGRASRYLIISIVVLAGVGALWKGVISRAHQERVALPTPATLPAPSPGPRVSVDNMRAFDTSRVANMERRLQDLEDLQKSPIADPPKSDEVTSVPSRTPESRIARELEEFDQHEQALAEQQNQSVDLRWATEMEQKIRANLQALPTSMNATFGVSACRSNSCSTPVSWPSLGEARAALSQLAAQICGNVMCEAQIALPPTSEDEPVQAVVLTRFHR